MDIIIIIIIIIIKWKWNKGGQTECQIWFRDTKFHLSTRKAH
jgi:hypothetical protein